MTGFIWHASGPRPCHLCEERDGQFYTKEELPFDHPNGMCTFETAIDPDIDSCLAAWFWAPAGTYPEIDRYAEALGFDLDEISL